MIKKTNIIVQAEVLCLHGISSTKGHFGTEIQVYFGYTCISRCAIIQRGCDKENPTRRYIFAYSSHTLTNKFHLLQMTSTPPLGAALFGVGRIGQVHLKNMVDNARLRVQWLVDVTSQHDLMTRLIDRYRLTGEAKVLDIEDSDKVLSDPG